MCVSHQRQRGNLDEAFEGGNEHAVLCAAWLDVVDVLPAAGVYLHEGEKPGSRQLFNRHLRARGLVLCPSLVSKANKPIPSITLESWLFLPSKTADLCCRPPQLAPGVSHTSTRKPLFVLTADPLLLTGILFPWPLCLRNGLRSPADWPKPV